MASTIPTFTLNNGVQMPGIGAGSWLGIAANPADAKDICLNALKAGYRHIDTAPGYGNEQYIGEAVRESGVPRDEVFICTKLGHFHDVRGALDASLKALDTEYIDLYLLHWPQTSELPAPGPFFGRILAFDEHPNFVDAWREMEGLLESGKVRAIGVSNFSAKNLEILLDSCKVVPAVNQVEVHVCLPQRDLQTYCREKGILLTAYSPLGQGNASFFNDADITAIAKKHSATPAQVALSWLVQRGTPPVVKSVRIERMRENLGLVTLSPAETQAVEDICKKPGMHRTLVHNTPDGSVFGWTYEQLGWPFEIGGAVRG